MGCCASQQKQKKDTPEQTTRTRTRVDSICHHCSCPFDMGWKCPMIICNNYHNACMHCVSLFSVQNIKNCFLCKIPLMRPAIKDRKLLEIIEEQNRILNEPSSPQKKQYRPSDSIGLTLQKAQENGYDQVRKMIEIESFSVTMIDEKKNTLKAIIDLSIFRMVRFLNLSSIDEEKCGPTEHCKAIQTNGSLGFGTLPNLKELHMRNRHLHYIPPLGILSSLQTLGLGRNGISRILNLQPFKALKYLFLFNNRIQIIQNLETLVNLECLNLGGNNITKIQSLEAQKKLIRLQLYKNRIAKIENLDHLTLLTDLDLDENQIILVENLKKLKNLNEIQLKNNPINVKRCREEIRHIKIHLHIDLIEKYQWEG